MGLWFTVIGNNRIYFPVIKWQDKVLLKVSETGFSKRIKLAVTLLENLTQYVV